MAAKIGICCLVLIALIIASSNGADPTTSESPCPAKHVDCYQAPVREQPGMQMMMLGIWRTGPKKGQPFYSLEDLEENRRLFKEMLNNQIPLPASGTPVE